MRCRAYAQGVGAAHGADRTSCTLTMATIIAVFEVSAGHAALHRTSPGAVSRVANTSAAIGGSWSAPGRGWLASAASQSATSNAPSLGASQSGRHEQFAPDDPMNKEAVLRRERDHLSLWPSRGGGIVRANSSTGSPLQTTPDRAGDPVPQGLVASARIRPGSSYPESNEVRRLIQPARTEPRSRHPAHKKHAAAHIGMGIRA